MIDMNDEQQSNEIAQEKGANEIKLEKEPSKVSIYITLGIVIYFILSGMVANVYYIFIK